MTQNSRPFALGLIAFLILFWSVVLFATWGAPHALYGWNLGSDGQTLTYIVPGDPAATAGLQVGDRVDWAALPLVARANLAIVEAVSPGSQIDVTVSRSTGRRTVRIVPKPWPPIFENASRALTIAGLFLAVVAIMLVWFRPSRMTWGFLLSSLFWAYPTSIRWLWAQSAPGKFAIAEPAASLLFGAYAAGILIFMSRFPSDRPLGPLRLLDRAAIPFGLLVAAIGFYIDFSILYSAGAPVGWALFATQSLIQVLLFAVALAALITTYVLTRSCDRQRVVPVLIAFAFYVSSSIAHNIYSAVHTNAVASAMQYLLMAFSMAVLAVAVAYAIVRHRVFDISFAISRTVVYTILTSIVVGVLALIDFVSSKLLERLQIAILLEICAALAFGIWLNVLHARVDRFVDSVLFKRRHLAEARLDRTGRALMHAESTTLIDEALVFEACDSLALTSAAVFRRDGAQTFVRTLSRAWEESQLDSIPLDDHLAANLFSELEILLLADVRWQHEDVPRGIAQPLLAAPLTVRHQLLGFVLYGGHTGGEAIDPDEQHTLWQLACAAAAAYEHVHAKTLLAENNELRAEVTLLQHEQRLLRETIEALQKVTR